MVRAYVLISANAGRALDVAHSLRQTSGVTQVDAITGEYDVIAQVEAEDIAGVGRLIVERVQACDGVYRTITCLAIQ